MKTRKHALPRRPFTPQEDALLISLLGTSSFAGWDSVARHFQERTARQCRERWANYLCPEVRTGPWTPDEDLRLGAKVAEIGHAWAAISRAFHGRSENDVKNRWYTHLQWVGDRGAPLQTQPRKRIRAQVDAKGNAMRLIMNSAKAQRQAPTKQECQLGIDLELFEGERWDEHIWD
jgi:hypothetical protein